MNYQRAILFTCITLGGLPAAFAQTPQSAPVDAPAPTPFIIDSASRKEAIDALVASLNAHYVFPETARRIETFLRSQQQQGAYDAIVDGDQLAARLTADVRGIAHDAHMEVAASAQVLPPQPAMDFRSLDLAGDPKALDASPDLRRIGAIEKRIGNYGIAKAERITPRIAYLKISRFPPPHLVAQHYADTIGPLADADAMIIDLRDNGGGFPHTVALLASYFVDQRTHVSDLWSRDTGKTLQFWTTDSVAGTRFGGKKPLLVLVGPGTKSAGEDFAYAMQALKRATIMGETTWGGAHAAGNHRLGDHFSARIPDYRSINPVTGTNWEGKGVVPEVAARPADALAAAVALLQRQLGGR